MTDLKPSCTGRLRWTTGHTRQNPGNRKEEKGSVGTTIGRDAPRTACTRCGSAMGLQQPKGWCTTSVQHALSGTNHRGNTLRAIRTAHTGPDQQPSPPEVSPVQHKIVEQTARTQAGQRNQVLLTWTIMRGGAARLEASQLNTTP